MSVARRLSRAERRVEILEQLIEDNARDTSALVQALAFASAELASTQHLMPSALVVVDGTATIIRPNQASADLLGYRAEDLVGAPLSQIWPGVELHDIGAASARREVSWRHRDGSPIAILVATARHASPQSGERIVCVGLDLRERHRDEIARAHARKLESLGQLSAGIAHEINTPMQFISDNVELLHRGDVAARALVDCLLAMRDNDEIPPAIREHVEATIAGTRWDYFAPRMDRAFERARDGVARVTNIVAALKLFSHPRNELAPIDLNACLTTTLTVASPELKHVARIETSLAELPPIVGHAGDLNQVFLNLLVNAAHAIADGGRDHGCIEVRTRVRGERVEIEIADTGCGIPDAIRDRVFDPFFTTKEPGRGTGQGLALAYAVVVERHQGDIRFDTSPTGTTFVIDLPIAGPRTARGSQ